MGCTRSYPEGDAEDIFFFQGDAELDPNTHDLIPLQGGTSCWTVGRQAADGSQLPQVGLGRGPPTQDSPLAMTE